MRSSPIWDILICMNYKVRYEDELVYFNIEKEESKKLLNIYGAEKTVDIVLKLLANATMESSTLRSNKNIEWSFSKDVCLLREELIGDLQKGMLDSLNLWVKIE